MKYEKVAAVRPLLAALIRLYGGPREVGHVGARPALAVVRVAACLFIIPSRALGVARLLLLGELRRLEGWLHGGFWPRE